MRCRERLFFTLREGDGGYLYYGEVDDGDDDCDDNDNDVINRPHSGAVKVHHQPLAWVKSN